MTTNEAIAHMRNYLESRMKGTPVPVPLAALEINAMLLLLEEIKSTHEQEQELRTLAGNIHLN